MDSSARCREPIAKIPRLQLIPELTSEAWATVEQVSEGGLPWSCQTVLLAVSETGIGMVTRLGALRNLITRYEGDTWRGMRVVSSRKSDLVGIKDTGSPPGTLAFQFAPSSPLPFALIPSQSQHPFPFLRPLANRFHPASIPLPNTFHVNPAQNVKR